MRMSGAVGRDLLVMSAVYGAAAALQKLLWFGLIVWLASRLTVPGYATFGLLYALQQGLASLATAGVVEAMVGRLGRAERDGWRTLLLAAGNRAFLGVLATGLCICVGVSLLSPVWRGVDLFTLAAVVLAGLASAVASYQAQVLRLQEQHWRSVALSTLPAAAAALCGFIGFNVRGSLEGFFLGCALGAMAAVALLWNGELSVWRVESNDERTRGFAYSVLPFALVAALGWLGGYGNNYLINLFLAREEVAQFTFALSLCSVMLLVAGSLNQVWSPRFYKLVGLLPLAELERKNARFYSVLALILGAAGAVVVAVFPSVMNALGGGLRHYANMSAEITLLFSGYVVLAPFWQFQNHLLAAGLGGPVLRAVIVSSSVGIASLIALGLLWGHLGVYVAFVLLSLARSAALAIEVRRHWPLRLNAAGVLGGLGLLWLGYLASTLPKCCR